ncbi:uncharacterized protein LOC112593289 [Melanaphis sacchari]|uniref:uncharacterized protein LOC112593289 n=1 Tax=Melanaphis sacchari TaxID=742174 RepID=UPI000DC12DFC|nr:uncharacterized protein LOC112593289 [Melanaphis sacchari]
MNLSLKYLCLLTAFLLLWYSKSTIEAKEILECDLESGVCNGKDIYIKQQQDPSGKPQLISSSLNQRSVRRSVNALDIFWLRKRRTTTFKPKTNSTLQTESTIYHSNFTTELWNTTTAAPNSTHYYNSTTKLWNTTTVAPNSTHYSNFTTKLWNTTTVAPNSTHYSNFTTKLWNTTTAAPNSKL